MEQKAAEAKAKAANAPVEMYAFWRGFIQLFFDITQIPIMMPPATAEGAK